MVASGGASTFEQVRLFVLKRSKRSAPSSQTAKYTVARDVLIELQKLELIQAGVLPRTQSMLQSHSDAPCQLTESGRSLAHLYHTSAGRAYDHLLLAWINHHPHFRAFIIRVHQQPLYVPDVTSIKQLGSELKAEENLDALARRISTHCLKRLATVSFPTAKADAFTFAVGERVQDLGRTAFADLDAKKWVDTMQDRIIIPALLTAESLHFTDAVTFQHVLKAAKDFFAASWTSSHPQYSLRVIFPTCEFLPSIASDPPATVTGIVHHGKAYASPRFVTALKTAYDQVAKRNAYADAYAVRALVCIDLKIQPMVFDACLGELLARGPTSELTIYTEVPFGPPPQGEDYVGTDPNRISLLKVASS
jgi:hypothetical protein